MNDALEILHKQWYENSESSNEVQELYQLFCNTGDKANDDMCFSAIAEATFEESRMAFYAGFSTAISIFMEIK